jgi:hypothetical protein
MCIVREADVFEAFALIRQYSDRQGWSPMVHQSFQVGSYRVWVNATSKPWQEVPPLRVKVSWPGFSVTLDPFRGVCTAGADLEGFIAALRAALDTHPIAIRPVLE